MLFMAGAVSFVQSTQKDWFACRDGHGDSVNEISGWVTRETNSDAAFAKDERVFRKFKGS
jgi:hypothetical protein